MKEDKKSSKKNKDLANSIFPSIIKGVSIGYGITAAVFVIYALLLTFTDITEKNSQMVVIGATVISVLTAGFITAAAAESKGWLYGMLSGFLYAVILIMLGIVISPEVRLGSKTVMIMLLSLAGGGLGGIVGINIKK